MKFTGKSRQLSDEDVSISNCKKGRCRLKKNTKVSIEMRIEPGWFKFIVFFIQFFFYFHSMLNFHFKFFEMYSFIREFSWKWNMFYFFKIQITTSKSWETQWMLWFWACHCHSLVLTELAPVTIYTLRIAQQRHNAHWKPAKNTSTKINSIYFLFIQQ